MDAQVLSMLQEDLAKTTGLRQWREETEKFLLHLRFVLHWNFEGFTCSIYHFQREVWEVCLGYAGRYVFRSLHDDDEITSNSDRRFHSRKRDTKVP